MDFGNQDIPLLLREPNSNHTTPALLEQHIRGEPSRATDMRQFALQWQPQSRVSIAFDKSQRSRCHRERLQAPEIVGIASVQ